MLKRRMVGYRKYVVVYVIYLEMKYICTSTSIIHWCSLYRIVKYLPKIDFYWHLVYYCHFYGYY